MSVARLVGIMLVVIGSLALIYRGFTYTDREQIVDIGPIEATAEHQERVDVPVWAGIVILGGGVLLLLTGRVDRSAAP